MHRLFHNEFEFMALANSQYQTSFHLFASSLSKIFNLQVVQALIVQTKLRHLHASIGEEIIGALDTNILHG